MPSPTITPQAPAEPAGPARVDPASRRRPDQRPRRAPRPPAPADEAETPRPAPGHVDVIA